ncbi:MAG: FAD-dependent oxidoreductase [Acidobacteriota bacterium]
MTKIRNQNIVYGAMEEPKTTADVVIIGGGPAGMAAAFWCAELGLDPVIVDREVELGGQLLRIRNVINNYLGVPSMGGGELRDRFLAQLDGKTYESVLGCNIGSVNLRDKKVTFSSGAELFGKTMIIATGVRRRELDVPGAKEFIGRGILDSGVGERGKAVGKRVVIVGGGDAAIENAVLLSAIAEQVFVVHRRKEFSARSEFVNVVRKAQNVEFLTPMSVDAILGGASVEAVTVGDRLTRKTLDIPTDLVLIRIGVEPNTDLFVGQTDLTDKGYVSIDNLCATNLPGVFAIGDVANFEAPTISAAVGSAATAAKAVLAFISEAS